MESKLNNTIQLLATGESFIGKNEVVNGYTNIVCNLSTTKDCVITCEQSMNGTDYQFSNQFAHVVSVFGTQTRTQFSVKAYYARITLFNATVDDIPKIVLTTLFTNINQDSSLEQPFTIAGDVQVINSLKATYTLDGVDNLRNVACDANGVLKSNLVLEGITLTPQTDGLSIYGTDGTQPVQLKTSLIVGEEGSLQTTNTDISKIEVNVNKPPTLHETAGNVIAFAGDRLSSVIDLGEGVNRDRNIVFFGVANSTYGLPNFDNPKIVMKFTHSLATPFVSDGAYASYYKKPNGYWEFVFQRSNCPLRYVQLYADTNTGLTALKVITSKD